MAVSHETGHLEAMKTTFLIGTRHDYQRPGNPGSKQFRAVVTAACGERQVRFLAEEMSLEALNLFGASTSVCKQVADAMRIPHRYCDPSRNEQRSLGIANPARRAPARFLRAATIRSRICKSGRRMPFASAGGSNTLWKSTCGLSCSCVVHITPRHSRLSSRRTVLPCTCYSPGAVGRRTRPRNALRYHPGPEGDDDPYR